MIFDIEIGSSHYGKSLLSHKLPLPSGEGWGEGIDTMRYLDVIDPLILSFMVYFLYTTLRTISHRANQLYCRFVSQKEKGRSPTIFMFNKRLSTKKALLNTQLCASKKTLVGQQ